MCTGVRPGAASGILVPMSEPQPQPHPLDAVAWPKRTERLVLRRAGEHDIDALWQHRGRDDVGEWLGWHPVDRADWEASMPARLPDTLVFELDGRIIGDVLVSVGSAWSQREVRDRAVGVQAELGWTMHPDFEGRGYASEAVREVIRVCFEELGLHRIQAGAFTPNEPSQKLMRRVGMRLESSSLRDALHRDHGWVDGVMYGLLAEEWRRQRDGRAPRATILHGFTASPEDHWFPWLAERLEAAGFEVRVPALPDAQDPDADAWQAAASDAIGEIRDGDAVIGHSLGALAAVRVLAERARRAEGGAVDPADRLGSLVLVSGFAGPVEPIPELDRFAAAAVDLAGVPAVVRSIAVLRSDDDAIVPAADTEALAAALGVPVEVVPGGGHFLGREGWTKLPAALWPVLRTS